MLTGRVWLVVCAVVTTVAGSGTSAFADGLGTAASFTSGENARSCTGIFVTSVGDIMVMEYGAHRIRMVATSGIFTVFSSAFIGVIHPVVSTIAQAWCQQWREAARLAGWMGWGPPPSLISL